MWNIVPAWLVFVIGLSLPDDIYGDADFNFYDEFGDVSGPEIDEIALPAALVLNINVYLDVGWLKTHKTYAEETARQTIAQASRLLKHPSLNTRIELVPNLFNDVWLESVEASQTGFDRFDTIVKEPWEINGSPVTHLLLTLNDSSPYFGKGRKQSVCSSKVKPIAIARWVTNAARTAITVAHELGHVLGMHHDFERHEERGTKHGTCGEGRDKGAFMMNYGEPRLIWSECSNLDFKQLYGAVHTKSGKFCLKETKDPVSCFEENINYQGFTSPKGVWVDNSIVPYREANYTESWEQCGKLCKSHPDCLVWTWLKPAYEPPGVSLPGKCLLKSNKEGREELSSAISGSNTCPRDDDAVRCSWGGKEFDLKCERKSENSQECETSVCAYPELPKVVRVYSNGGAGDLYPQYMGDYRISIQMYSGLPVYKHDTNTEAYLYMNQVDYWVISGQISGVQFFMSASLKGWNAVDPPTDGWSYLNQTWLSDVEMKTKKFYRDTIAICAWSGIQFPTRTEPEKCEGEPETSQECETVCDIPELPPIVHVNSNGGARDLYPEFMGIYRISSQYYSNLPVYKHATNKEAYLYVNDRDFWVIHHAIDGDLRMMFSRMKGNSIEPLSDGWEYWVQREGWHIDEEMKIMKLYSEAKAMCIWGGIQFPTRTEPEKCEGEPGTSQECEETVCDIPELPEIVKVYSSGGAGDYLPQYMGDYRISSQYYSNLPVYKHVTKELYLYVNAGDNWVMSWQIHGVESWMKANLKGNSIEPPSDGWFYWDNEKWQFDEEMRTIKFHSEAEAMCAWDGIQFPSRKECEGEPETSQECEKTVCDIPELPEIVRVHSSGGAGDYLPEYMGDYRISSQYYSNLPVYKHVTKELYLYVNNVDNWVMSWQIHGVESWMKANLKENSIEPPSDGWFYWDNEKWQLDEELKIKKFNGESKGCTNSQFQCNSGSCIPLEQRCDLTRRHCPDGEDEEGCDVDSSVFE